MIYYNEFDKKKVEWLKQLQKDGLIAQGETDGRDIKDVLPAELAGYERCHFFAGIAGWELACEWAGWEGPIWTASCPCQPFSAAGRRAGLADERHLFPALHWLIDQCQPPVVVGEQVASKDGLAWLDTVFSRLEASGYTCAAVDLCAAGVGAPHIRQRLYWVAYTNEAGQRSGSWAVRNERDNFSGRGPSRYEGGLGDSEHNGSHRPERNTPQQRGDGTHSGLFVGNGDACGLGDSKQERCSGGDGRRAGREFANGRPWDSPDWVRCVDPRNGKETYRPVEPGLVPLAHGVPARVVRISGYGDAIVPQLAATFLEAVKECLDG